MLINPEIPIVLPETPAYYEALGDLFAQDFGVIIVGIPLLLLTSYLFYLKNRLSKKKKHTTDISIDGPFILYLRAFSADETTGRALSWINGEKSEEEETVSALSDIADIYAIGNPKDRKMPLGAKRVYVDDENWKSAVVELAKKAELIVLRLGATSNFWWEVEMALSTIPVQRLLFIVPTSQSFSQVSELYRILLQHNIDISSIDLSVRRAHRGSISSFLFFDSTGKPRCSTLYIPRFTRFFLSYQAAIKKALNEFRTKYGLSSDGPSVKWSRVLQVILFLYFPIVGALHCINDLHAVKYQCPYELAELCIRDSLFTNHHGDKVNENSLIWGIHDSKIGLVVSSDSDYKYILTIETEALEQMDKYELSHLDDEPFYFLQMIKKYLPEEYPLYVSILSKAAINYNNAPEEVNKCVQYYQGLSDVLPQWLQDMAESVDVENKDSLVNYGRNILSHINEPGMIMYYKIAYSLSLKI